MESPTSEGPVLLLAFPWMLPHLPYGVGSAFWGTASPCRMGSLRGAGPPMQHPHIPASSRGGHWDFLLDQRLLQQAEPPASRLRAFPSTFGSWSGWVPEGTGAGGFLDLLGAVPVSAHPITVAHHPRVAPAPCPCPPSPSTAHFLSLDVIRVWEHPREHPPRPGTSRGVLGARPPLHRTGMPFVLLGVRGNSAALGFSLLFWKFKTFAGRPTRALPPRREALG